MPILSKIGLSYFEITFSKDADLPITFLWISLKPPFFPLIIVFVMINAKWFLVNAKKRAPNHVNNKQSFHNCQNTLHKFAFPKQAHVKYLP